MKNIFVIILVIAFFSCKNEEKKEPLYSGEAVDESQSDVKPLTPSQALGKEIFEGKGNCLTCHKPDQKVIGPSITEIATIYKEKNGDMVTFLKGKGHAIVDPEQYEVMKTNFYITKNFSDEELKAVEDYFMSHVEPVK